MNNKTTTISVQTGETTLPLAMDDRIFLGEGLFETLKVLNHRVLYPKEHWQRLQKASSFLAIPFDLSFDLWSEKLDQCIHLKKLKEGGIKAILSGGSADRGLEMRSNESHLMLQAFQYVNTVSAVELISAPWQRDASNPIYQMKSINYLEAIIARRHARTHGADDVLFFNFQHDLTETTIANVFVIKNNKLLTPPLQSGVLPGLIRQRIITLCNENNIQCIEKKLNKVSLIQADSAFTCNTLQGIRPIKSFEAKQFKVDHPLIDHLKTLLPDYS